MLYPLVFRPIFKERVWGGSKLADLYGKPIPSGIPIGESWEVSDRPGDVSVVENGPLAGRDLSWLLEHHAQDVLGNVPLCGGAFPLLIKILDAREKLSLQVHPPAAKARELGGDPKTEMWYIADADPGAELYVGLKSGVTREEFEARLKSGDINACFHRIPVRAGDTMFLPSGRVHAIGAGLVIFEIQQNSDTTYRVYDWGRVGLDGKPRQLHVEESLASIDFDDFEPALVHEPWKEEGFLQVRQLVRDPLFTVSACRFASPGSQPLKPGTMRIIGLLSGELTAQGGRVDQRLKPGDFCLIPACLSDAVIEGAEGAQFLDIIAGLEEK